jgi:hypothetical protein
MSNDRIFLHIGLPKTATTFLQQNIFPIWPNMEYRRSLYFPGFVMIDPAKKYIISNEELHGNPFVSPVRHGSITTWLDERRLIIESLARLFPDARIMISFRKHSGFILSLYKELLHCGGNLSLEEYFDISNDAGYMKKADFIYKNTIDIINANFEKPPFVFLFDEVKGSLGTLLNRFERLFGEKQPPFDSSKVAPSNVGVGYWQGRILRFLNSIDKYPGHYPNPKGILKLRTPVTMAYGLDPTTLCQRRLKRLSNRPLVFEPEIKEKIDAFYADDWRFIKGLAAEGE